jgi:hypothetical protein
MNMEKCTAHTGGQSDSFICSRPKCGDVLSAYNTEPRVVKMYWAYWNGEKYVELEENKRTRHYADLSLIVETENYNDGDTVEVTIESDGEEQLFDGEPVLKLNGIVFDNRIVFEGIFNKYTLN